MTFFRGESGERTTTCHGIVLPKTMLLTVSNIVIGQGCQIDFRRLRTVFAKGHGYNRHSMQNPV